MSPAYTYDKYGQLSSDTLAGQFAFSNSTYDAESEITGFEIVNTGGTWAKASGGTYDVRGDLVGWSGALNSDTANGIDTPTINTNTHGAGWDALMGVVTSSMSGRCVYANGGCNYSSSSSTYDALGREASSEVQTPSTDSTGSLLWSTSTIARTFDAENRVTAQQTTKVDANGNTTVWPSYRYIYWPSGHIAHDLVAPVNGTTYNDGYTLHWNGNQALFETNASGQVVSIAVGTLGTITLNSGSAYEGITFFWRDVRHGIGALYNAAGYEAMGSTSSFDMGTIDLYSQTDQISFAGLTLQGVRAVDSSTGQWLTPDAYPGDLEHPISQKSYVLENNNSITNEDPSGFTPYLQETNAGLQLVVPYGQTGDTWAGAASITLVRAPYFDPVSAANGAEWFGMIGGPISGALAAGSLDEIPIAGALAAYGVGIVGQAAFSRLGAFVGGYFVHFRAMTSDERQAIEAVDLAFTLKSIINGLSRLPTIIHEVVHCASCFSARLNPSIESLFRLGQDPDSTDPVVSGFGSSGSLSAGSWDHNGMAE